MKGPVSKLAMKFFGFPAALAIIISLASTTPAIDKKNERKSSGRVERSTSVDPNATITLCVMSGKITVRGWEKNELRVRSTDVDQIEFRRIDKARDSTSPAKRIDVMIIDKSSRMNDADCQAFGDVEMDVPSGSTVQAQTRDGDIHITGVAAAYAGSQNGDIAIEKSTKLVEAGSVGGSISLKESSGRISLSSAGGGVEASNVRPLNSDDTFEVGTVSGDIQLSHVNHVKLVAKTVNGTIYMTGPLAHAGNYGFTTMSGDVNLTLPADASFQLNAKISNNQTIVSDFVLKPTESWPTPPPSGPAPKQKPVPTPQPKKVDQPPKTPGPVVAPVIIKPPTISVPYALKRVTGVCGSGDSFISVASFGGTLRLKKL